MSGKYCVLGYGIGYTLSPLIHTAFYERLREAKAYGVEDIPPDELDAELPRLLAEYDGFNVTKPHKESVAKMLGAGHPVNTVASDGRSTSTDGIGFLLDYTSAFGTPAGRVLILGAGGAAKSVAEALTEHTDAEIFVYNRTYEKAAQMRSDRVTALTEPSGKFDSVINCTSAGLKGEQASPDSLDLSGVRYAYDLIYSPAVTPFMRRAESEGAKVRGGIGMLVYQAIASQEFWRGKPFSENVRRELYDCAVKAISEK